MSRELTHEEAFIVLDAVALDALDTSERDAVLAHAATCAICGVELSQLRETAAYVAFASPLAADTATLSRGRIRSRLMARASADAPSRAPRWRRTELLALAASMVLFIGMSLLGMSYLGLRARLTSTETMMSGLVGKDVAMMKLTSTEGKAASAQMFWDKAKGTWTLVAHDMPDARPGRTYQLWLMTPTAKVSAGTFESKNGKAMMRATYPLSPDQLKMLAVTEEPMGGMPQPTGPMIMVAQAH